MLAGERRVRERVRSADGLARAYEQRTPLLGFTDDIDVRFVSLGESRASLAVYSRSRVGYSDLGTNRKRVMRWLAGLEAAGAVPA